jgi:SAM-dependent methyltransferase
MSSAVLINHLSRWKQAAPKPLRSSLRWTALLALDTWDALRHRRLPMVPPRRKSFVGPGDFERVGSSWLRDFVEFGGLEATHHVLDVGCGIGRMAVPLTRYLAADARYEGIDVVASGIDWCAKEISSRHPNFRFSLADVRNALYQPRGRYAASEYRFPFDDETFDFAFATSLFTHMQGADARNYLRQAARVLRPGGRLLASFYLLNPEARQLIDAGKSTLSFRVPLKDAFAETEAAPEAAVAHEEADVREWVAAAGLKLREPIQLGAWCGREPARHGQDYFVAFKV